MQSRDQQLCKFLGTKNIFTFYCVQSEHFDTYHGPCSIVLGNQYGGRDVM